MNDSTLKTIDQVEAFLSAASQLDFSFADVPARHAWMTATLARFCYHRLSKPDKGVLRRYLEAVTGYSRAQVDRHIRAYRRIGKVQRRGRHRHRFAVKYTAADIRLRARTDELHNTLCGPATKKIFERAHHIFGDVAFVRLARISVSHLYNLRRSVGYQRHRHHFEKTKPRALIGKHPELERVFLLLTGIKGVAQTSAIALMGELLLLPAVWLIGNG